MILPGMTDFLRGKSRPRSNDERLALLGVCQFQGLYSTAARLYAEAFAADPKLAEVPDPPIRYKAAGMASLAGSGRNEDAADSGAPERARWRRQAREWLRADLASLSKQSDRSEPQVRETLQRTLESWRIDPDLAGLRDPVALERLTPSERQECQSLWRDLDALLEKIRGPR